MTITAVAPGEWGDAFALLYGPGAEAEIAHAFRLVARGKLSPTDLLVARRGGRMVGAVFGHRLPGSVAILWPPSTLGNDPSVEDGLMATALAHVAGVKVVQTFLPHEQVERAEPLLRAGFRHVTRLWQMASLANSGEPPGVSRRVVSQAQATNPATSPPVPSSPATLPAGLRRASRPDTAHVAVIPYADCDPTTFHATLIRAHDDSLDCPELNTVLGPEEVLTGFCETARDPATSWLATADGRPAGVALVDRDELSFLGVVPEWRGQGIGRRLLEAVLDRVPAVSLAVDVRNRPAFQLYCSAGLSVVGAREVFLYFPSSSAGINGTKLSPS